jgi:3-oxoacyl-[acyl-carrier-protein] synthase III
MAVTAAAAALRATSVPPVDVAWLVHTGSGYQGANGWPVHHHIAGRVTGPHANAVELRQYCAGGLTSWLVADGLRGQGAAVCTAADNWSWTDRFAVSRRHGGEPFSDAAHAVVLSGQRGIAAVLGTGQASCPEQADQWRTRENHWEHTGPEHLRAAFVRAGAARDQAAAAASSAMVARAIGAALSAAHLSPQYVTHFVPHSSGSAQPYRHLADAMGLPWQPSVQEFYLDHGYLGASAAHAGLLHLAETGSLRTDSIVLMLAAEYTVSATAVVLRIITAPRVHRDGAVTVIS